MAQMPGAPGPQPGWYPDPEGSHAHRYWDGRRWTDALSNAIPPASPTNARDDSRGWAVAAHLSAPLAMVVAMAFLGPLAIYLAKKDDPYVRRHAAEALNFSLSCLIYAIAFGVVAGVAVLSGARLLALLPVLVAAAALWIVLICLAAVKAGQGDEYRYPLTIRFVS
jgi:uncharacterized Tic20 family protein